MESTKPAYISKKERTHYARIIGLSLSTMFLLGIFAEFFVRTKLIDWTDPSQTYTNIHDSLQLFSAGILAFTVIILLDVMLAIAFYVLFNSVDEWLSIIMTSLRLVYVAVKAAAIIGLVLAKDIYAAADAAYAQEAFNFLKMHHFGFGVSLIFFGFHLVSLALLLFKAHNVPRLIVWMLLLGGAGYVLNSMTTVFASDLQLLSTIIIVIFIIPMTFSELILGLWLWSKSRKIVSPA